jgi:hypothetical protein
MYKQVMTFNERDYKFHRAITYFFISTHRKRKIFVKVLFYYGITVTTYHDTMLVVVSPSILKGSFPIVSHHGLWDRVNEQYGPIVGYALHHFNWKDHPVK